MGALAEFAHRIKVAGKRIVSDPSVLLEAVKKAKLSGLWLPDNRRMLIDKEVPEPKHRWIEAHETTHSFVPWHAHFLLGDNESTLDPECHEIIEAEANFGAGRLLFLGGRFAKEARDYPARFASIKELRDRYGNTLTSTFWRFVEDRDPASACFGLISQHPRHANIGARQDGNPIHHFITSEGFRNRFPNATETVVYSIVQRNCTWARRGPVIDATDVLLDQHDSPKKFYLDGFCNTYQVLGHQID